jgi:hypothetical protein
VGAGDLAAPRNRQRPANKNKRGKTPFGASLFSYGIAGWHWRHDALQSKKGEAIDDFALTNEVGGCE